MSDLTTKQRKRKSEKEQKWDKLRKPYKKPKQEGNGIDNYTAILTSMLTAKPTKMRKLYATFLKATGIISNLILEVIISYIFKQSPNLKRGPISVDRQLTLA